jgi:hypothetical protein
MQRKGVHLREKAVALEMSCVYGVECVLLRRLKNSFYLLVMCYIKPCFVRLKVCKNVILLNAT